MPPVLITSVHVYEWTNERSLGLRRPSVCPSDVRKRRSPRSPRPWEQIQSLSTYVSEEEIRETLFSQKWGGGVENPTRSVSPTSTNIPSYVNPNVADFCVYSDVLMAKGIKAVR